MNACCVICIDEFGAASAARFAARASDIGRADAIDPIFFLWAGNTPPPAAQRFWRSEAPRWAGDERGLFSASRPSADSQAEPNPPTSTVESCVRAWRWLFNDFLTAKEIELSGKVINVVLVGSLAKLGSAAQSRCLLAGLASMRQSGELIPTVREVLIAGIGGAAEASSEIGEARATAATALLDLGEYFRTTAPAVGTVPVYLVGEESGPERTLGREAQIDLAATTLLALIAENIAEEGSPRLMKYERSAAGLVRSPHLPPYQPSAPFVAVGAAVVIHARESSLRERAALAGADLLKVFAASDPDSGSRPFEIDEDVTHRRIEACAAAAALRLRALLPSATATGAPWTWEAVKGTAEAVLHSHWDRLLPLYGKERFMRLPLEDWEQALSELSEHVDASLRAARGDLRDLGAVHVEAVEAALAELFDEVGAKAWSAEVDFAPRTACRRVIEGLAAECERSQGEGEKDWVQRSHHDERELTWMHSQAAGMREKIHTALRKVPSPIAVAVRLPLAMAAGLVLGMGVPMPEGLWDIGLVRAILGTLLGIVPAAFLMRSAWRARKGLLAAVDDWIDASRQHQRAYDERLVFESAQKTLATMRLYCQWLLDPNANAVFSPRQQPVWVDEGDSVGPRTTDAALRRRALTSFSEGMGAAAQQWHELARAFATAAGTSGVVFPLPTPADPLPLDTGFPERLDDTLPGTVEREAFRALLGKLRLRMTGGQGRESHTEQESPGWIPLAKSLRNPGWLDAVEMPPLPELTSQEVRSESTAFAFHSLMTEFARLSAPRELADLIASHYGVSRQSLARHAHSNGDLFRHLNTASSIPVVLTGAGTEVTLGLASSNSDSLVSSLGPVEQLLFSKNLCGILRLRFDLTAEDVIFGGDPEKPVSNLGRAYRAFGGNTPPASHGLESESER